MPKHTYGVPRKHNQPVNDRLSQTVVYIKQTQTSSGNRHLLHKVVVKNLHIGKAFNLFQGGEARFVLFSVVKFYI